ncbi:MAG: agmatine deiminase family protein [Deltaproteobacteria bacterium]|nr:agmatine deiminase family protein [Deltaproteobacteria bacterium]
MTSVPNSSNRRFPAEWEPHDATWLSWPHEESDFPLKLSAVRWAYAEMVRHLARSERVEILCHDEETRANAVECLRLHAVDPKTYRIHDFATDRGWLRDSAPTAVLTSSGLEWIAWKFNAWAKYDNYAADAQIPAYVSKTTERGMVEAMRPDGKGRLVLEGGAIETDGLGTMLTTEQCLLSPIQERNPGLTREGYESAFAESLGIQKTIWIAGTCSGDDTHGHIDDAARFVAPGVVVVAVENDSSDENYAVSQENKKMLQSATDARGRKLEIIELPMPAPLYYGDERLPASYANFYIANSVVIVPTFNDPLDRVVLSKLEGLFPTRTVVGIHAVDFILGYGSLHCSTQQQPAHQRS